VAIKSDPQTWTDPRHLLGLEGEIVAKEYLERSGYRILEHRFRVGRFEVDLIAERSGLVAFVEVKTRRGGRHGSPAEAVTWGKRREMVRVAKAWEDRSGGHAARRAGGQNGPVIRFDVMEVLFSPEGTVASVRHIEDAFRPGWR
jgi:putative endonuclease